MTLGNLTPLPPRPPTVTFRSVLHVGDLLVWLAALLVVGYTCTELTAMAVRIRKASSPPASALIPPRVDPPSRGQTLASLLDVDFTQSEYTLLFVLSNRCVYCSGSMRFYRDLASRRPTGRAVRFVAACFEPRQTCASYLQAHEVAMDEVVSLQALRSGLFSRIPMLILVNRAGHVMSAWVGQQSRADEGAIQARLRQLASAN